MANPRMLHDAAPARTRVLALVSERRSVVPSARPAHRWRLVLALPLVRAVVKQALAHATSPRPSTRLRARFHIEKKRPRSRTVDRSTHARPPRRRPLEEVRDIEVVGASSASGGGNVVACSRPKANTHIRTCLIVGAQQTSEVCLGVSENATKPASGCLYAACLALEMHGPTGAACLPGVSLTVYD